MNSTGRTANTLSSKYTAPSQDCARLLIDRYLPQPCTQVMSPLRHFTLGETKCRVGRSLLVQGHGARAQLGPALKLRSACPQALPLTTSVRVRRLVSFLSALPAPVLCWAVRHARRIVEWKGAVTKGEYLANRDWLAHDDGTSPHPQCAGYKWALLNSHRFYLFIYLLSKVI